MTDRPLTSAATDPRRWERLWELFDAARALREEERERFLARECGGDRGLAAELGGLLAAADAEDPLLDQADRTWVGELIEAHVPAAVEPAGSLVGDWRLVRLLGEGGMGTVWLAEREGRDFRQRAAIKLLRGGAFSPLARERFLLERRILARLEHPGIARFLDGGFTADGMPWLALELVEGEPITAWCSRHAVPLERRLELFLDVCDAVAFAHRDRVVHRDLKPSNILVTEEGRAKLLDFGVAKLLPVAEEAADGGAPRTLFPALTPAYAAPEQLAGGEVTPASDVYALGRILFELLVGRLPAARAGGHAGDSPGAERPSSALLAAGAGPASRALARRLRGDLDRIVTTALAVPLDRRYPSVERLAEDLRRHLAGRPVLARGDSLVYRAAKFVRRHRAAFLAASAGLAVGALALWLAGREDAAAGAGQEARAAYSRALAGLGAGGDYGSPERRVAATVELERAVRIDPGFAPAQAALGAVYAHRYFLDDPDPDLEERALVAIQRALELDPKLAEAWVARAQLIWNLKNGFPHERAVADLKRALALRPDLAEAHRELGKIYFHVGLVDRALAECDQVLRLVPDDRTALARKLSALADDRRLPDATRLLESSRGRLSPSLRAYALLGLGRTEEALADLRAAVARPRSGDPELGRPASSRNELDWALTAVAEARLGHGPEARALLERIEFTAASGEALSHLHHLYYSVGAARALLGEPDEALRWLARAAGEGYPSWPRFARDPDLDALRGDPRFVALLARLAADHDRWSRRL